MNNIKKFLIDSKKRLNLGGEGNKKKNKNLQSVKLGGMRMFSLIAVVTVLSWGISYASNNDIESATSNFSVMGTVSTVSDIGISIIEAKGSNNANDRSYDLNIRNIQKVETSDYVPLNISDIKVGDKIVAQGLTNGSVFFIKRIVSFTSSPYDSIAETATTTESVASATSTEDTASTTIAQSVVATSTEGAGASGSSSVLPVVNEGSATSSGVIAPVENATTSTEEMGTSSTSTEGVVSTTTEASTSTEEVVSTTTEESTSTPSIMEGVTNVIEGVVEAVTNAIQDVVDVVTGSGTTTPEVIDSTTSNTDLK